MKHRCRLCTQRNHKRITRCYLCCCGLIHSYLEIMKLEATLMQRAHTAHWIPVCFNCALSKLYGHIQQPQHQQQQAGFFPVYFFRLIGHIAYLHIWSITTNTNHMIERRTSLRWATGNYQRQHTIDHHWHPNRFVRFPIFRPKRTTHTHTHWCVCFVMHGMHLAAYLSKIKNY